MVNNGGCFLFYWRLILLLEKSVEFENTCTVSGKWNENAGQSKIQSFGLC